MSSGSIVNIPYPGVPWLGYTGDEIRQQFEYFKEYADEQRETLSNAIEELNDVLGNYDPSLSDVSITVPTIDGPSFPATPSWPPLNLDDNWPESLPGAPVLMPYPDMDFQYTAPTPPAPIAGEWNWLATTYTSEMWTALFNKVHTDILNGGHGLTADVYDAIVAREQEARRVNQDRQYQKGLSAVGSTGFNLPSGHVASFQREFQVDIMRLDQDALNNLLIKDFDLATENTRFAVTTGVELEKLLRSTWEVAEKLGLEAQTASSNYIVATQEANIKLYLAGWEGIRIDFEALKAQIDAIVARNDGQVKVYLGQAQVFETEINAIVAKNKGLVDARKSEADIYETQVKAVATQYQALVAQVEAEMKGAALEVEQAIANSKIDLDAYLGETNLAERIAESQANIAAQAIASALGAMNVGMTQGYSSSESRQENFSHSEQLYEGHSYEEV